ncbi:unnamed protein product [Fusarium fujikuroi]|uniref:Uncharacterized protein n=1 Tax=Fusarium fujikuroi TaxID=5127 RepID=A0A9Q9UAV9_FUSFU|nr:unnamed protein product [Fusarium fujikuroi]
MTLRAKDITQQQTLNHDNKRSISMTLRTINIIMHHLHSYRNDLKGVAMLDPLVTTSLATTIRMDLKLHNRDDIDDDQSSIILMKSNNIREFWHGEYASVE